MHTYQKIHYDCYLKLQRMNKVVSFAYFIGIWYVKMIHKMVYNSCLFQYIFRCSLFSSFLFICFILVDASLPLFGGPLPPIHLVRLSWARSAVCPLLFYSYYRGLNDPPPRLLTFGHRVQWLIKL